ncbi:MAG TPA: hypothetical protein VFV46_07040 [Lacibacter sp.]|nr:hypothetical protein [Lacibacter sp.]
MNINRHNYEEFFLLYVDHELTAAERVLVETFIQENPDLKAELDMLLYTTMHTDARLDESFKHTLLKQDAVTEEQLLLLLDGELRKEEAIKVQNAIVANTHLQQDWAWLQRSKLSADTSIVFPDKSLLYKEAQPVRVLYMNTALRRWSAAAAIVLMMGTGYWLYNRPVASSELVDVQPSAQQQKSGTTTSVIPIKEVPVNNAVNEAIVQQQTKPQQPAAAEKSTGAKPNSTQQQQQVQQPNNTIAVNDKTQQQPLPVVVQQTENPLQTQTAIVKTQTKTEDNRNNLPASTVQHSTSMAASTVSYVNFDDESDEDEQEGLLNENKQRSTGLKALLKKAKRTLERRTGIQSGESQVRFAVFAVNTQ